MNGYTAGAKEKAKEVSKYTPLVLVDGEELRAVINGLVGFDDLVKLKRLWLDKRSEPFFKFRPQAMAV
jgi:hypothetical protein